MPPCAPTSTPTSGAGWAAALDYRAADVGLDLDELGERFAPYVDRFL